MGSNRLFLRHTFNGGWATDFSPTALTEIGRDGNVAIPYMLEAENIVFERNSAIRKVAGSARINSSEMESGAAIVGVYDAWFSGTTNSPSQHRIVNVGTTIKKDDANGTFTNLFTGISSGAIPTYAMIEDLLIIGLSSSDVPRSWDGSTAQNLAGSPPNCSIFITHGNRVWGAGDWSNPSRLWYSPLLDPENTTGEGWGKIDIDPDDGDILTGIASHRGELICFKGPYKGSIHRVQGSSPTGSDAFRRPPGAITRGITAAWHNLIFPFGNDLGFVTPTGQIQSLSAVQQYGDFDAVALSRGLRKLSQRFNFSRLTQGWAATNQDEDFVAISVPIDGSTTNNLLLVMDYAWNPPRFVQWPAHECASIAMGVDASANNRRIFLAGGGDGFLRKLGQTDRSVDGIDAISMRAVSPFLDYNEPFLTKHLGEGFVEFAPKNNGDIDFYIRRDSQNRQLFAVSQLAGDPLGTVSGTQFTLGISALAESTAVKRYFEFEGGGDFRQVRYDFENDVEGEDVEVHSFGVGIELGAVSTENDL